jgi:2-C-methyl-D-erythritol 2,4-cyclodiphosphate synthase
VSILRVGQGFDLHRFSDDPRRALVLGGVRIEDFAGLAGHSDADVVAHALADALLAAAALGDLGGHFPDDDATWRDADSIGLLEKVTAMVGGQGLRALNADCTIVCEKPRLAPHTGDMQSRLESVIGAPVSVKAKRAEGLGALGRVEGIACMAVALVCSAESDFQ